MESPINHICNLLSFPATSFRRRQCSSTKSGLTRLLLACFGSRLLQGLLLRLMYRTDMILLVIITNQRINFIFESTSCSRSLNDILLFTSPQILRQIVQVMMENYADNGHSTTKDTKTGLSWYRFCCCSCWSRKRRADGSPRDFSGASSFSLPLSPPPLCPIRSLFCHFQH